jgi:hypothetical protein
MLSLVGRTANSIRWREGQKEKLAEIAKHCGVEVVDLIRNAADAVIKYAEAHNGVVPFPLDFEIGFTPRRLVLREPPAGRLRQELVRPVEHSKMKTGSR